ncbi:MAG: hypothetical protein AB7F99_01715 [Vicinamibacterales bacterium]
MAGPRIAFWLLTRIDASGFREALIGDLMEEIAQGRSHGWIWRQVLGLYAFGLLIGARRQARLTPQLIVVALTTLLLAGISIAPPERVVGTWVSVYLLAGLLALLADAARRTASPSMLPVPVDSEL